MSPGEFTDQEIATSLPKYKSEVNSSRLLLGISATPTTMDVIYLFFSAEMENKCLPT